MIEYSKMVRGGEVCAHGEATGTGAESSAIAGCHFSKSTTEKSGHTNTVFKNIKVNTQINL